MIITYYGKQFFKIQLGEMVLAVNPVSKNSKFNSGVRFGADIALSTTNHPDYNGIDQLSYGDRVPFLVDGPGDFEVRDVFIKGIQSKTKIGDKEYINTIYSLSIDNINITFLGAFPGGDLAKGSQDSIGETDLLFVPIGNDDFLDAQGAAKIITALEPKMVIPMDYDKDSLKAFLKEMGEDNPKAIDKLTLKKKDLEEGDIKVVVLST